MRRPLLLLVLVGSALAHTDLNTKIEGLTQEIAEHPTAELFYQRATEYRALRENEHAIDDLRAALKLKPDFREARFALAEALGGSEEALKLAKGLIQSSPDPDSSLPPNLLLIRIHRKRGDPLEALAWCRKLDDATRDTRGNDTEVDLLHADLLLDLDRPAEAAAVLKAAWERTKSIVARNNWIDAALSAGQSDEIIPIIEEELRSSRLRSSWYLRRARTLLIHGKKDAAQADLRAALVEINPRINPGQPDLTLVADRGLIHALMGHPALAKRDLATLKKSGLPPSAYRLLTRQLEPAR